MTTRISRVELRDLLDATIEPERQMVTLRMPALVRTPDVRAGSDVTWISVICAVSMTFCGALARFG